MKTTVKRRNELYRELRNGIGVKTNVEAENHRAAAERYFKRKLAEKQIKLLSFSVYDGEWALQAISQCQEPDGSVTAMLDTKFIELEEWLDTPNVVIQQFVEQYEAMIVDMEKQGFKIKRGV